MATTTTCNSTLLWNSAKVAKVTNLSLNIQRGALDETGIGECDGSYVSGRRDATATARILYDPDNGPTVDMMNRILAVDHTASDVMTIESRGTGVQGKISASCIVTSIGIPYAVGELMAADITLQLSGPIGGLY